MKPVKELNQYFAIACGAASLLTATVVTMPQLSATAQTTAAPAPTLIAQAETTGPLTQEEALARLAVVPVFAIVSEGNAPVLANIERDGQTVQLMSFWLDQEAAQTALSNIQEANPDVGSQARLVSLAMNEALRVAREQQSENDIQFRVWPDADTVEVALQLLNETEEEAVSEFRGVPLFYGESSQGVLTVEADGAEIVPFFFSRDDLQATLDRAGDENAAVASQTEIRVTNLDTVMNSMIAPDAESNVGKIEFVPSRSALEYARTLPAN